jgi:hypothetical protein
VGATGQCALFTRGLQLRQACEGLVKLLPRKCITHSEARALLHPVRARNPPPGPERITGFFPPIPPTTPTSHTDTVPTVEQVLPTPLCSTLGNSPRQAAAAPGIERLSPFNHNVKWCTRPLAVTQVYPGITMNLVPVADHSDADMWEAFLQAIPETALHDWAINWARQCPCIQLSWDTNPTEVPGSQQSLNYRTVPTVLKSYYELPRLALNIFLTGRFTLSYGKHLTSLCGYSSPQLACPLPLTARSSPSRLPFQLLEATHLISYERGLLCIPPRRRDEPEPWENHPIMQSLLKRLQSKWHTHRAQARQPCPLPLGPNPAKPHLPKPKRPLCGSLPLRQCTLARSVYATAHHPLQPMPSSPRGSRP